MRNRSNCKPSHPARHSLNALNNPSSVSSHTRVKCKTEDDPACFL